MFPTSYSDDLANFLKNVTGTFDEARNSTNSDISNDEKTANFYPTIVRPPNKRFASEILDGSTNDEDTKTEESKIDGDDINTHFNMPENIDSKIKEFLEKNVLSHDKSLAVSIMVEHFKMLINGAQDNYVAPVLLVTGGPGVGKSFLVDVLDGV